MAIPDWAKKLQDDLTSLKEDIAKLTGETPPVAEVPAEQVVDTPAEPEAEAPAEPEAEAPQTFQNVDVVLTPAAKRLQDANRG
jgi:hypothetical protein